MRAYLSSINPISFFLLPINHVYYPTLPRLVNQLLWDPPRFKLLRASTVKPSSIVLLPLNPFIQTYP